MSPAPVGRCQQSTTSRTEVAPCAPRFREELHLIDQSAAHHIPLTSNKHRRPTVADQVSNFTFRRWQEGCRLLLFFILGLGKTACHPPVADSDESHNGKAHATRYKPYSSQFSQKIWYWKSKDLSPLQYDHLSTGPDLLQLIVFNRPLSSRCVTYRLMSCTMAFDIIETATKVFPKGRSFKASHSYATSGICQGRFNCFFRTPLPVIQIPPASRTGFVLHISRMNCINPLHEHHIQLRAKTDKLQWKGQSCPASLSGSW